METGTDIVLDPSSGIPVEEQQEILNSINSITAQNREALSAEGKGEGVHASIPAKKKGIFFPVLVNVIALILLGGGVLIMVFLQGREELIFREGPLVFNSAERALIQKIRSETAAVLQEKDNEIALVYSRLEGLDGDLRDQQRTFERQMTEKENQLRQEMNDEFDAERKRLEEENLSEAAIAEQMRTLSEQRLARMNSELGEYRTQLDVERLKAQASLQKMQEEYRANLLNLQGERSKILEDSRAREASLRAQFEQRTEELGQLAQESNAALNAARAELERLATEQQKVQAIEGQLGGYYGSIRSLISGGRYADAEQTLIRMKDFINTAAFRALKTFQSRREIHLEAIASLEALAAAALKAGGPSSAPPEDAEKALADLEAKNAALQAEKESLSRMIEAGNSQGSDMRGRIAEYERNAGSLQARNAELEAVNAELGSIVTARENSISALQTQVNAQSQQLSQRENRISELETQTAAQAAQIENLNTQLTQLRQALRALSQ
ncbi:MAG: hypothetical protein LBG22_07195 [Treponema sp.]|jgi:chromosome segregation ATPase|nr:hypothetical protein [Treponema sp.]